MPDVNDIEGRHPDGTPIKQGIINAVGVSAVSQTQDGKGLAKQIEAAMSQAVLDASADGVTDPDEVRARMLAARDQVKAADKQENIDRLAKAASAAANPAEATAAEG